jgi:ribonuclease HI
LAALNRFISKSAERSLPFLKTLRSAKEFAWGPEQAAAFAALKQHLSELAILTSPNPSLPLLLYVAASPHAVSAALVQEQAREGTTRQCPVYYVSKVLTTSKCNMTELEKIAYAVVMASRKLRHYFKAFKVLVTSDRGLSELFRIPEASVRIAKWAAKLSGYHITFEPRTAIKSQVLADFIIDWTGPITQPDTPAEKVWTIHCDGAWCHAGAGVAAVITSLTGVKHRYAARLSFALESDRCTNNVAEYEAVILGLRKLWALGVTTCIIKTHCKVVVGQVEKDYAAKDPTLMQYLTAVHSLERQFKGFTLQHVDRAKDEEVDALAKAAARGEGLPSDVFYHVIGMPAVRIPEGLQITNDTEGHRIVNLIMTEDWQAPITLFLQGYYHPSDINEAKRLKHQSRDFALFKGQLYKKGVSQPMLKCITETEGVQILREVHSGTCGSHAGPRALTAKVIRQSFYWPTMICAANRVTRSCEACQKFSPCSGNPSQFTKLIAHTWPLQRWGLDIVGPLPTAQGNLKLTFIAVKYFTKWIEARVVSTITLKTAQKFFWQNIVCRFGVPSELTVDNDKQFDSQDFKDFCFSIGTKLAFASVYHPQSNGVVERANGKIFTAIKKMLLDDKKGKWADLLPEAVWALNTTKCRANGFTSFRLLYGSEAMTSQEIKHGSPRTSTSAVPDVDEPTSKDLIDGDRVFALQALNKYQAQTKAWRDHIVVPREFNKGDLVLVRTTRTESRGKLEPKWEGERELGLHLVPK